MPIHKEKPDNLKIADDEISISLAVDCTTAGVDGRRGLLSFYRVETKPCVACRHSAFSAEFRFFFTVYSRYGKNAYPIDETSMFWIGPGTTVIIRWEIVISEIYSRFYRGSI